MAVGDKTDFYEYVELDFKMKDRKIFYDWLKINKSDVGIFSSTIASSSAGEAIESIIKRRIY